MRRVVLLGPLAAGQSLEEEVAALAGDEPVALVTAGWEEGERNDADLDRALGGGTRNLGLYGRRLDVLESDGAFADAEHEHRARLAEMQALYRIRVRHALAAVREVARRSAGARRVVGHDMDEALRAVRALDEEHVAAVAAARLEFDAAHPPEVHDVIVAHRAQVAALVAECGVVAIAGGHLEVLWDCLRLFDVVAVAGELPLVCWSAAAALMAERVWVVDDRDLAQRPAQVRGQGFGVVQGVVPLPDAAERLRDDLDRRALLARRLAPRACLLLDPGDRVEVRDARADLAGARLVAPDGGIRTRAEAA